MKKAFLHVAIAIFSLTSLIIVTAVNLQAQAPQSSNKFSTSNLLYKIIDAPNKTYGYDIYAGDKKIIHQPSVPALPGNEGFKTKTAAEKVAQLVIVKIKKGESLPTITIEEMKKLHAIK